MDFLIAGIAMLVVFSLVAIAVTKNRSQKRLAPPQELILRPPSSSFPAAGTGRSRRRH